MRIKKNGKKWQRCCMLLHSLHFAATALSIQETLIFCFWCCMWPVIGWRVVHSVHRFLFSWQYVTPQSPLCCTVPSDSTWLKSVFMEAKIADLNVLFDLLHVCCLCGGFSMRCIQCCMFCFQFFFPLQSKQSLRELDTPWCMISGHGCS